MLSLARVPCEPFVVPRFVFCVDCWIHLTPHHECSAQAAISQECQDSVYNERGSSLSAFCISWTHERVSERVHERLEVGCRGTVRSAARTPEGDGWRSVRRPAAGAAVAGGQRRTPGGDYRLILVYYLFVLDRSPFRAKTPLRAARRYFIHALVLDKALPLACTCTRRGVALSGALLLHRCFPSAPATSGMTRNSTRRFLCRPATVALSSHGKAAPKP